MPTPSRRVLAELVATFLSGTNASGHDASPVQRALATLTALLDAQGVALAEVDRIEAELTAQTGYPRVTLPVHPGSAPSYAADAATIRRHLGDGPAARRLTAALRRRRHRLVQAAEAAGLPAAQAHEHAVAAQIGDVTAALLLTPVADLRDLILKLIVLIAISEPGPDEGSLYPAAYWRALLADVDQLNRSEVEDI
ncbi:hypothetical protein MKK88_12115 [Methylobacterium sp. E-005]|uniref:hypothetical protein n=1 Tax=Methylobacterium sp. E-005 TaxID=2836549 RepID=UPI001FB9D457|nr:hypothetical protein [Methylobacterium sp. E-005]MCJ2086732.1 hypothetical protein [Methylobacterium sp. E-005]